MLDSIATKRSDPPVGELEGQDDDGMLVEMIIEKFMVRCRIVRTESGTVFQATMTMRALARESQRRARDQ